MSASSPKPGQNAAARQGRKKMRLLAVLGAITLLTWSRQLFGGEGDKNSAAAKPGAGAKEQADAAPAKTPRSTKSILTFEQAMERMTQWPEALNRRVIDGPIEDLSPINWHLDPLESVPPAPEQPAPSLAAAPADDDAEPQLVIPRFEPVEEQADGYDLGIVLRSTVLFGAKRFAVLNGVRYAEGDVVLAGGGRYLLVSVRARAVTLSSGDRTWTLVIRDQSTPDNKPEQAE